MEDTNLIGELPDVHFIPEGVDAILAERMILKSVMADLVAGVNGHRSAACHGLPDPLKGIADVL
jgi:hypothetical protein